MRPLVSVIVPTLNEARNLPELVPQVAQALRAFSFEILILDDQSTDDTTAVCAQLATRFPLRLISRAPENGLSGAVLAGMRQAEGDVLVVMDADLQHPPASLPDLIRPLLDNSADFVLGSRYVCGGSTREGWTMFRRLNSRVATALARPIAGNTHDPMSGFFALRRGTFKSARHLTPLGYKIALELMCKCDIARERIVEIPIEFGTRVAGESKLSVRQQFKYLEHLSRLYDYFFPRLAPVAKFLLVTAIAWLAGLGVYGACLGVMAPPPALFVGYAGAILATAAFHLRYVRTQKPLLIRPRPWRDFALISLCEWAAAAGTAGWASLRVANVTSLELFMYSFAAATIARYILRKELLQDIRGLRKSLPAERAAGPMRLRRAA